MKYFEVLIKCTTDKSHYEGRFFSKSLNREQAVKEVGDFLELDSTSGFKIFTRELTLDEYLKNQRVANKRKEITNKLLENCLSVKIDNISYEEINKIGIDPEFVDLRNIV